jgi:hydroxymethylbilane synthase
MNHRLEGGCQVPIAGYAVLEDDQVYLRGLVGRIDGSEIICAEIRGPVTEADSLGTQLADDLLARGAADILKAIYAG